MIQSVPALRSELGAQMARGAHLMLYGPRGSGKSTLVAQLHASLGKAGVPCAISPATTCLNDMTRAFAAAYPDTPTRDIPRRAARSRLWNAADRRRGVLLLDHVTEVNTAMLGFLRRLRGGVVAVLLVVDVEDERERQKMRAWRVGSLSVRMAPTSTRRLNHLLQRACAQSEQSLDARSRAHLLRAARGRPGWILHCVNLLSRGTYWHEGQLYLTVLCSDTEMVVRQGKANPLALASARAATRASELGSELGSRGESAEERRSAPPH